MHKVEELRRENERRRQLLEEAIKARDRLEETVTVVQRDTRRINSKWKTLHTRTAEARSYLCREAATLYGLRQKRRRSGRTDYSIGGVPIPNFLQDLNCMGTLSFPCAVYLTGRLTKLGGSAHPHIQITTSLAHLAHLLLLVSHYLGLKLPNEIILPTQSAPHTQIRGVLNARHTVVRPLYLDRPLSELSRDSPAAHTKFIEGISLLAINVSYLCFTQGLEINEVDPACAPGANMWQLLVSREPVPAFGRVSHATCNGNLATAPKIAAMTRFKVGYKSVVEKIRNTLQGETIIAGWDLVPDAGAEPAEGKGMGWTRIRAPGEEK